MTPPGWQRESRLLATVHLVQAAALLGPASRTAQRITGNDAAPPTWIVRILGARILLQAAPEALAPNLDLLRLGIGVDIAHATSMLAAARIWPQYQRAALVSAAGAAASAVAGSFIVRRR